MAAADILAGLRPIRAPALAEGALIEGVMAMAAAGAAAALVVAALVLAVRLVARGLSRRSGPRRRLRDGLRRAATLPPEERLAEEARLLRAYAAAVDGVAAAATEGDAWLATLDRLFATTAFTAGPGRVFGAGLYAPGDAVAARNGDLALRRLCGLAGRTP